MNNIYLLPDSYKLLGITANSTPGLSDVIRHPFLPREKHKPPHLSPTMDVIRHPCLPRKKHKPPH